MESLVTVIVPVYGVEKYIRKCVNSILRQTYSNIEIILVDDGSPDKSGEICDQLKKKDCRIRVIHKENGGVSSARNRGIEAASGEYLMFVDSDDWLPQSAVTSLLDAADKYQADFVFGCATQVGIFMNKKIQLMQDTCFDRTHSLELLRSIPILRSPWAKLFSAEIIKKNGLYFQEDISYAEDRIFVWSYLAFCRRFAEISDVVYYYSLLNPSNACSKYYPDINKWLKIWIEPACSLLKEDRKFELQDTSAVLGLKELQWVCICYANAKELSPDMAVAKIKESCEMYREFLPESMHMGDNFAQNVISKDYARIYNMLRQSSNEMAEMKRKVRNYLLRIKQFEVFILKVNRS